MVTLADIEAARRGLPPEVVRTPVLPFRVPHAGQTAFLKAENLQVTGSYKARAAFTVLASLDPAARRRGAVLASSGNFAAAFAFMGGLLGIPTAVVMMRKTAPYKVERTRSPASGYPGAEILFCEDRWDAREELLARLESERGLTVIHHYEDPRVIAGHGTIGLEILEECPEAGLILVPVSSGGLLAGVAAAVKALRPEARVIGVQPEGADAMARSLEAGRVVHIDEARTMCDALVATHPGELPLRHAQRDVEAIVRVSEQEIADAVRILATESKLVAEPGGAVTTAAMLSGRISPGAGPTVALVSGGNIAPERLAGLLHSEQTEHPTPNTPHPTDRSPAAASPGPPG
jgi:threonine dehydratase